MTALLEAFASAAQREIHNAGLRCYDAFKWFSWIYQHIYIYQCLVESVYMLLRKHPTAELPRSIALFLILWHSHACTVIFDRPAGLAGYRPRATMAELAIVLGAMEDREKFNGLAFDPSLLVRLPDDGNMGFQQDKGMGMTSPWRGMPAVDTRLSTSAGSRVMSALGSLEGGPPEVYYVGEAFRAIKYQLRKTLKHYEDKGEAR
jgi:hypothetical protein